MRILAIESSGMSAGCAYMEDGVLKGEYYLNSGLTHSCTLLPMIEQLEKTGRFHYQELDAIAVSSGPGSFTGLRIGAATAKGLALGYGIPLIGISSLKGLAANMICPGVLICPVMDARHGEVYGAVYTCEAAGDGFQWIPLIGDCATATDVFLEQIRMLAAKKQVRAVFLGDGVPVHKERILSVLDDLAFFAPTAVNRQRASSIAMLGAQAFEKGELVSSDDFVPEYIRRPLAETSKEEGTLEDAGTHSLKKIAKGDFKRTKHPLSGKE